MAVCVHALTGCRVGLVQVIRLSVTGTAEKWPVLPDKLETMILALSMGLRTAQVRPRLGM